jgi:pantoate kinase
MGGQIRAVPGGVVGWDLSTALALADALGVNRLVAAEILPAIEPAVVAAINRQISSGGGERLDV